MELQAASKPGACLWARPQSWRVWQVPGWSRQRVVLPQGSVGCSTQAVTVAVLLLVAHDRRSAAVRVCTNRCVAAAASGRSAAFCSGLLPSARSTHRGGGPSLADVLPKLGPVCRVADKRPRRGGMVCTMLLCVGGAAAAPSWLAGWLTGSGTEELCLAVLAWAARMRTCAAHRQVTRIAQKLGLQRERDSAAAGTKAQACEVPSGCSSSRDDSWVHDTSCSGDVALCSPHARTQKMMHTQHLVAVLGLDAGLQRLQLRQQLRFPCLHGSQLTSAADTAAAGCSVADASKCISHARQQQLALHCQA